MKTSLFLMAVLLVTSAAFAQQPMSTVTPNTVVVGTEGKFESAPDTALVQFNIAAQEATAKEAYQRATDATQQIRQLLRTNGIDPATAQIGFFSLAPVYDYRTPKRKLVAYRVTSSVNVKLKDFSKVAPIVQGLSDLDVTENQNISYTLEDIDAAKVKAVDDAFQRARAEASAIAKAGGRVLGELLYASVDTAEPIPIISPLRGTFGPRMMARAETATAPAPTEEFSPQKITVAAHVNTMFGLK
jgi:uncharacterized protein YggE